MKIQLVLCPSENRRELKQILPTGAARLSKKARRRIEYTSSTFFERNKASWQQVRKIAGVHTGRVLDSPSYSVEINGIVFVLIAAVVSTLVVSCMGGDGIRHAEGYTVAPSRYWKVQDGGEADRAYALASGASVVLNSSCGRDAKRTPELLTQHLLFGLREIEYLKKENLSHRSLGAGLYSSVKAKLQSKPVFLEVFILPHGECVFDFSMIAERPLGQGEKEAFTSFIQSLKSNGKNK